MSATNDSPTLASLVRSPVTIVWGVLIAATALSWMLGTDHGFASTEHSTASVVILLIAFIKVRFIGLWFMELRKAPLPLRGLFETYCAVVATLVIGLFLLAG